MKILVAGGSGFVGRELSKYLSPKYRLTLLTRSQKSKIGYYDDLLTWSELDEVKISDFDIVINLCGYNIGQKRWSNSVKNKIISSRIEPTTRLVELIGNKNIWLINASAIGYYNFSDIPQDEEKHDRQFDNLTFGQQVVDSWEKCLVDSPLARYTIMRFGVVIGNGGVLEKMIMPAKFGFLTMFGNGHNYMTWISVFDLSRAVEFIIDNKLDKKEVYNLTSPEASQHRHLIELLSKYLAKKRIIKIPSAMIKLMFGQMGEELLLSSQNIKPTKLQREGFEFEDPEISKALERYI
ncbi:TIGR01777 family oxidoreductase [Francisella marina]|uniref:TIGR01777 family protein n=1 Tax=Francisella marina TaxID=2249302 RepID=A0ABX5ZHZ2_9GAMM|nr:TIGR01777 family oxidoreductase [Francisella marina]QEO57693.1 TIGR01777 family protein [Francisella marina]QEO60081.1 TIGR01777 family protein [Francisella marina]